jgi:hypothetical protein
MAADGLYSHSFCMVPHNYCFPPAGRICMTRCQAQKEFSDKSQDCHRKINKFNTYITRGAENPLALVILFKLFEINFVD